MGSGGVMMNNSLSIKNILISIIKSIDVFNPLLEGHHKRTAIIAYQLGNSYGLEKQQLFDLVLAASLHDIGALSIKEKVQLFEMDLENPEPHEIMGEQMLMGFKPFEKISKIIRYHHIQYEDIQSGRRDEKVIPLESYFICLADRIDIMLMKTELGSNQIETVIEEINKRFGDVFAPFLRETFRQISLSPEFWNNIEFSSFQDLLFLSLEDSFYNVCCGDVEELAIVFAKIIDYRSPWTTMHSQTVAKVAYRLAKLMKFPEEDCFDLKIAGYLHDIGKIAIPTEVLNKMGKLTKGEFETIKKHVIYSTLILSPIKELGDIVEMVSNHHEKHDQSGYPLKLNSQKLTQQMDVLAFADIFSALSEDRPSRKHMNPEMMKSTLATFIPEKLSENIYQVIIANFDELLNLTTIQERN